MIYSLEMTGAYPAIVPRSSLSIAAFCFPVFMDSLSPVTSSVKPLLGVSLLLHDTVSSNRNSNVPSNVKLNRRVSFQVSKEPGVSLAVKTLHLGANPESWLILTTSSVNPGS